MNAVVLLMISLLLGFVVTGSYSQQDCSQEATFGALWPVTPSGESVSQPCENVHQELTAAMISRSCTNSHWMPADYSRCLINAESALLLIWVPFNSIYIQSTPSANLTDHLYFILEVNRTWPLDVVNTFNVTEGTTVVFKLTLPEKQPSDSQIQSISAGLNRLSGNITFGLVAGASIGYQGFYEADTCYCEAQPESLFIGLCKEIVPVPACSCSNRTCECQSPYFIGDGNSCTIDEDGDGFPNIPLLSCSQHSNTSSSYCQQDNCPNHYNPDQTSIKCVKPPGFVGCSMDEDEVWEINWGNTLPNMVDTQRCPQGPGLITRMCSSDSLWLPAQASDCGSYRFQLLEDDLLQAFDSDDFAFRLATSTAIFQEIIALTQPGLSNVSILPFDLDSTNIVVNTVLELLEEIQEGELNIDIPDLNIADILSNILASVNLDGWISLQAVSAGSRQLLDISERYGLYLSRTVTDSDVQRRIFQRDNVVIGYKNNDVSSDADLVFPESQSDISNTFNTVPVKITIPGAFLQEQAELNRTSVPVSTVIYRNMGRALPTAKPTTKVASMVMSTQVAQRDVLNSPILQQQPITITFNFNATANSTNYFCAFWEFSQPVGSGGWRTGGLDMVSQEIEENVVTVICNASHLTSFAVLVDLSGTLSPNNNSTNPEELLALSIVSYIGCVISLVCLLAAIAFFLLMGRELFQKVHYFIHLNLAIALFLAYLMFVTGVETAKVDMVACTFVAVWLHYFFLASFSWMLCEGIMLYLMLVVIFSKLSKKWWLFLLIGYGDILCRLFFIANVFMPFGLRLVYSCTCINYLHVFTRLPVIPVIVTISARTSDYGVADSNGTLLYCWLSTDSGVIWAFVGPMLAIIMINVAFLVIALTTVFKSTRTRVKRKNTAKQEQTKTRLNKLTEKKALFSKLLIASIVLLPLLGVTWVLGIFAVNQNTTVFAWLFTIFNSLQGLFIFFFHVLRSDKVWNSEVTKNARSSISKHFKSRGTRKSQLSHYTVPRQETSCSIVDKRLSTEKSFAENYELEDQPTSTD